MSTKAQRRANKRNAQHSTGPKTEQGKQTSSQNPLKHGLLAKHPVIPGEDPLEYQHKLDRLRADLQPLNALEDDLVEQIADTSWRLKRLARIQSAVERTHIEWSTDKKQNLGKDDEHIFGNTFAGPAGLDYLSKLGRYESQLSRRYHRAVKEFTDLRKNKGKLYVRQQPIQLRDQEEQQWREHHRQPPGAETNGAPTPVSSQKATKQSQSSVTPVESTTRDDFDSLPPQERIKLIEQELNAMMSDPGPRGLREVK